MSTALPFTRPPHALLIEPIVRRALEEDLGRAGDITSELTVPADARISASLVARKAGSISGVLVARSAFQLVDPTLEFEVKVPDGSTVSADTVLAIIKGGARSLLTSERVALNFVGHLSGVATVTRAFVNAVAGTKARIV